MLDSLLACDAALFRFLNTHATSPFWDGVMMFFSGIWPWVLGSAYAIGFLLWKRHWRRWWRQALMFAVTIGLADLICALILKPSFERFRPCRALADTNVLLGCAGAYGFPSNHAANASAIAVFLILVAGWRPWTISLLGVALVISYSRIYVGAHYPLDVAVGFLLGTGCAVLVYHLGKKWFSPSMPHPERTSSS